ncbi:MAG: bifunctional diaminohydroxyphosphoribosylaminopyrimidine deaminase/5-amino-6-(5-phosphoribosylamino)uracil reductase RibD [Candidatus Aureabacteria bacterium]|nr:bifunctional diaminohydroxyphosphoribosylaminopyrimidine deaminase/5-amino-6-(5-phosphoribosylamino)uracil reductase RibD [Candidatus Auribacterota bacterium]
MQFQNHKKYMQMAFREAKKAGNRTRTNPLVGAVIVKNGKVISRGYHSFFGGLHAEEVALKKAGNKAKGADLFVTLEPCSTFGKRPPCTHLIQEYGIKSIYFASYDVNPVHSHKAANILKKKGIAVHQIPFEKEQNELNAPYIKCMTSHIPFIILKAGLTLDARLCDQKGNSKWITSKASRVIAHSLRARVNAVLIGAKTFNSDNPRLNIRLKKRNPFDEPDKIILSSSGKLNPRHRLFDQRLKKSRVIVATTPQGKKHFLKLFKEVPRHVFIETFQSSSKKFPLKPLLKKLVRRYCVSSLLVEGGADTLSLFFNADLYDRIVLFYSPRFFGTGRKTCPLFSRKTTHLASQNLRHRISCIQRTGPDVMLVIERKKTSH